MLYSLILLIHAMQTQSQLWIGVHIMAYRPVANGDCVKSGRCLVTPATYTHETIEQRGYVTRF
jgi:hypothetical protein